MVQEHMSGEVGTMLLKKRASIKKSQREMAKKAGVSQSTISRLENGEPKILITTVSRVLKAYNLRMRVEVL